MKPIVGSAQVKSASQVGGSNPQSLSTLLTGPKIGFSIQRQTTPISTPGMMYGRNRPAWKMAAPRSFIWCTSAAGASPRMVGQNHEIGNEDQVVPKRGPEPGVMECST